MMPGIEDLPSGSCPECGESPTEAHLRGAEIILVPCGHTIPGPSALETPPEYESNDEEAR